MIARWAGRAVSENRRLAPGRGRFRTSEAYRAFKSSLVAALLPVAVRFEGQVAVRLRVAVSARMDVQNVIKPVLDALEESGVLENDRQVVALNVLRRARKGGADEIEISVWEV